MTKVMARFCLPVVFVLIVICLCLALLSACDDRSENGDAKTETVQQSALCDPGDGGLVLPKGFCAAVVSDSLGFIRHLSVNDNGDMYVTMRNRRLDLGGLLALRDTDADGRMDRIEKINEIPGMGIALRDNVLYFASDETIYRYRLEDGKLLPPGPPEILVHGLPEQSLHAGKTLTLDNEGKYLYVNIGAPSNACQAGDELNGGPGIYPCPELQRQAGIWRFPVDVLNQTQKSHGERYASGIRNAYAIDWHPVVNQLYIVQHGRDQLNQQWPELYSEVMGAKLPAEEFLLIDKGSVHSWPYCYYDQIQSLRVLAPEYGGDSEKVGECDKYPLPLVAFPGHYGPNDLVFYAADQFPHHYINGALIAFHGSYNRGSYEQVGYQVVHVPFDGARPVGNWEVFIDGFAGDRDVLVPEDAEYRPTGLAIGPDGSLYVSDSVQGRIWRVTYVGQ